MAQELEINRDDFTTNLPPELLPEPPRRMTFEEFLLSDIEGHAEWVDGEVTFMTPPSNKHQHLLMFLSALLRFYTETYQLGTVLTAPFLMQTSADLPGREPDILFIATEHLDRLKSNRLEGAADIAVEIISPESRTRDYIIRLREYEQGGVGEYWLLDQPREQAEFYRLNAQGFFELVPLQDGVFRSSILPGLELKISWLWQDPLPTLVEVLREWKLI